MKRWISMLIGAMVALTTAACSSPQQGDIILELKYDEFLPDVIRAALQPYCGTLQAFSKYARCRGFG